MENVRAFLREFRSGRADRISRFPGRRYASPFPFREKLA
jgi:hypothetical protein